MDIDVPSIDMALQNAIDSGLGDRVAFSTDDVVTRSGSDQYDVLLTFECVHDMAQPVRPVSSRSTS